MDSQAVDGSLQSSNTEVFLCHVILRQAASFLEAGVKSVDSELWV